jgi:outer membrane protein assembly factor BamB
MNEHDLHASFGELARRGADDQSDRMRNGAGLSAPDVIHRSARARRRRAGVTALTGVAAVTGLVLAGSALALRPDPQPAVTPTPEITRPAPGPTPSETPAPLPTPTDTPADGDGERAEALTTGVVRSYPAAPTAAWSVAAGALWTPRWEPDAQAGFGDVTASYPGFPGFRGLESGGAWLVAPGAFTESDLVGLDAATGTTRWAWKSSGDTGTVLSCGGAHDGLLVCLARADGGGSVVQLRDPATGAAIRDVAPGGIGIVVVGDTLLVHDLIGERDVRVTFYDLDSGATRKTVDLPGLSDPETPLGDGVVFWEQAGGTVRVQGPQYTFAVDMVSGTVLGEHLKTVRSVRGDGWVIGTAADGSTRAAGPQGQDVGLSGVGTWTMPVWAPAPGVEVPLLDGSDPYDGIADVVRALDPATGAEVWSVAGADSAVAVVGTTVVLAAGDGLVAVDLADGSERWRAEFADVVATDGDRLFLSGGGRARAADLATGREVWSLDVGPEGTLHTVGDSLVLTVPGIGGQVLSALVP